MVFEVPEAVAIGEVVPNTIRLINSSALPKSMRINLTISAIDYTGSTLTNLAPHVSTDVEVPPGKIQELTLTLALADYVVACAASQLLEARLSVVEFSQLGVWCFRTTHRLGAPEHLVKRAPGPFHAGEVFALGAAWTNQLGFLLSAATLSVNTRGVMTSPDVLAGFGLTQTNLSPGGALQISTNLAGLSAGHIIVTAVLSSWTLPVSRNRGRC